MSRYPSHVNARVDRSQAELLQETLFKAAQQALATAMEDGKIPANLLSSCHVILRDAGLAIDLDAVQAGEGAREDSGKSVSPSWLSDLEAELGL